MITPGPSDPPGGRRAGVEDDQLARRPRTGEPIPTGEPGGEGAPTEDRSTSFSPSSANRTATRRFTTRVSCG